MSVHYFIFWLCVCSGFLRRPEEDQISWCWSCRWLWATVSVRIELWSSVSVVPTPNWRHFSSPWLNIFETGSHYVGPADLKFVSASSYSGLQVCTTMPGCQKNIEGQLSFCLWGAEVIWFFSSVNRVMKIKWRALKRWFILNLQNWLLRLHFDIHKFDLVECI